MKPTCPICPGDRKLAKNGFNASSGTQRYRCTAKGCTYSLSDSPHTQGRPTKWATAMTDADRQAEYRVRQDEKKAIETTNLEENPMKFTPATKMPALPIEVFFHYNADPCRIDLIGPSVHSEDSTIRASIFAAGYKIERRGGNSYSITGGTLADLANLEDEIKKAYGIIPKSID